MTELDENNRRARGYRQMRSSLHIGMGILYIIIGLVVLYVKYFGVMELSPALAYSLGSLMFLYGLFRIWRGWTDITRQD